MVYISLFTALISSVPCLYMDWRGKSPMVLFWLLNIPFVYLPFYFFTQESTFDLATLTTAGLFIALCNLTYTVLFFIYPDTKKYELDLSVNKSRDLFVCITGLLILSVLFFNGVDLNSFLASNLASKRDLGSWYLIVLALSALLFSQTIYLYNRKSISLWLYVVSIFLLILLYFRSRSIIGMFFLPLFFYILFFDKSKRYLLVIAIPLIFLLAQLIKAIRYQGSISNSLEGGVQGSLTEILGKNFTSGDLSIISVYFKSIESCNVSTWCGNFTFFQKVLSKFYFWSFEEKTIEYQLYDSFIESGVGGSLHPTSYGYAYADGGGFLGIIYFIVLFLSRVSIHKILLLSRYNYLYFGFIMYFILFFSRGSIYNGFIFLLLVVLIDVFLDKFLYFFPKKG